MRSRILQIQVVFLMLFGLASIVGNILQLPQPLEITLLAFFGIPSLLLFPGFNIVSIATYFFKRKFNTVEFYALSFTVALLVVPMLVLVENTILLFFHPLFPLINSLILFLATMLVSRFSETTLFPSWEETKKYFLSPYFLFPLFLYATLAFTLTHAFKALPDFDPYHWIYISEAHELNGTTADIHGRRPLFEALVTTLAQGMGLDHYFVYKHVLVYFFSFTIPAFLLLASCLKNRRSKYLLFGFPFINGVTFLFITYPIPQGLMLTAFYSALAFLLYSYALHKKNTKIRHTTLKTHKTYKAHNISPEEFFLFTGVVTMLFSYFYHEAVSIALVPLLAVITFFYRTELYLFLKKHTVSVILFIILILPYFKTLWVFIYSWTEKVWYRLFTFNLNFLFPYRYTNIDNIEMGWGSTLGVIKYYAFYMGPVIAVLTALLLFIFLTQKKNKRWKFLRLPIPVAIISMLFVFVLISDILPRIANYAMLPERAWSYAGPLFLGIFFLIALNTKQINKRWIALLLILGFFLNIGAVVYINNLKKYMITDAHLTSAQWIQDNTPTDSVFYINSRSHLIKYHARRAVLNGLHADIYILKHALEKNSLQTQATLDQVEKNTFPKTPPHRYIYYSPQSKNNPYADRPYNNVNPDTSSDIIFDQHPNMFERVYEDPENNITIWKIL